MTETVVLYHNPRCSKSRAAKALLDEKGIGYDIVPYLDEPPTAADLRELLQRLGTDDPATIVRRKEPEFAELGLARAGTDEILHALATHPRLLERPIVVRGDRAVVARPPERLETLW